ncbi:hypothetical protein Pyrfu_0104 [Pyrolobus fumarii 1A]|uniref:Uncharacterized protein n=1 Tax=Pyrolobus fumarii (strain DSM 11204 / 1A) TaxID=694429 RepID=G0EED5_PYRF1|nr:hypothetical protein [Pyrolobus fumarii]AEM37976.1 hypothetical protein Pyrfu_0104 [Pyrolobus fumarii 1A]
MSVDELVDLLRPVLESIADQYSSRPSKEQLLARLLRNQDKLLELIASYLADTREKLNEQQLEFVIYHGGTSIVRHVPRLYRAALEIGRDDLVDILRSKWIEGGVATPHQCPRCNFYSLTPALTCLVCGAEIDEKEFKEAIGFRELLEFFAQEASVEELRDAISEKRVLYDGRKIKAPSMARSTFDIELRLEPNEVKILEEALRAKKGESRGT